MPPSGGTLDAGLTRFYYNINKVPDLSMVARHQRGD